MIGGRDPKRTPIEQTEDVDAFTVKVTDPPGCTGEVRLTSGRAAAAVDGSARALNSTMISANRRVCMLAAYSGPRASLMSHGTR